MLIFSKLELLALNTTVLNLVRELRSRFPDKLILVDLKTMDAGEYEATPFYAAGADICTVLGVSGLSNYCRCC